jgi:riboflavin kinase/FMN adenylyltransferase
MEVNASAKHGRLLVIGNFDGVHLGHQAVLQSAAQTAAEAELRASVLTFEPHPAQVLGRTPPPLLTTSARKRELVSEVAPEVEFIGWPFTRQTADLSPQEFAREVLVENLSARIVVVGQNFRFGKDRAGDLASLERLGKELGFVARVEALRGDEQGPFSSTRVRQALSEGRVRDARDVLGRWHRMTGKVAVGDGRGRTLGFPTANLHEIAVALPLEGVYCGLSPDSKGASRPCVVSIGRRPTVERPRSVEVHLLDFDGDLYGAPLSVDLVARLRDIERFPDVAALTAQISRDIGQARELLSLVE